MIFFKHKATCRSNQVMDDRIDEDFKYPADYTIDKKLDHN